MENIILNYKDGDRIAEEMLIESILKLHKHEINLEEAKILLQKKYGKAEVF